MVDVVERMISTIPKSEQDKSIERLNALKAFIYRPGHWNENRPFQYDHDDPYGNVFKNRLLSSYLKTRKGNCISMPILFLALGERLRLKLSLSTAPLHVLVKYTDGQTGKTYNLEPTSGAGFSRDSYYKKQSPSMTDEAIRNGVYLRNLSRKETIAVMAMVVVEHLINVGRNDEAIAVSDVIIKAYPANAYALVKKGAAYYRIQKSEFIAKYPNERDIPAHLMPRALELQKANQRAFQKADALGWKPTALPTQ